MVYRDTTYSELAQKIYSDWLTYTRKESDLGKNIWQLTIQIAVLVSTPSHMFHYKSNTQKQNIA